MRSQARGPAELNGSLGWRSHRRPERVRTRAAASASPRSGVGPIRCPCALESDVSRQCAECGVGIAPLPPDLNHGPAVLGFGSSRSSGRSASANAASSYRRPSRDRRGSAPEGRSRGRLGPFLPVEGRAVTSASGSRGTTGAQLPPSIPERRQALGGRLSPRYSLAERENNPPDHTFSLRQWRPRCNGQLSCVRAQCLGAFGEGHRLPCRSPASGRIPRRLDDRLLGPIADAARVTRLPARASRTTVTQRREATVGCPTVVGCLSPH